VIGGNGVIETSSVCDGGTVASSGAAHPANANRTTSAVAKVVFMVTLLARGMQQIFPGDTTTANASTLSRGLP
jgi:hypothetical protein